jgi:flavin-dependent dehydrogenase
VTGAIRWDAIVVGAGPAGSLAAHGLARAGASVLLIDRATFPRPKACGCCLNGRAWAALEDAGLAAMARRLRPHRYDSLRLQAWRAEARLRLPTGFSLSRERLDMALIEAAQSAGASLTLGARAAQICRDAQGYSTVDLEDRSGARVAARSRVVIVASGLGSPLALRHLGGESVRDRARIGASATLPADTSAPWSDDAINMIVSERGYVGAVRLEDGRWNVAAALDADAVAQARAIAPAVREVLAAGSSGFAPDGLDGAAWRGTPALSRRPRRVAADGLFAVGDAAGYIEPFTGEGMACALQGARAVVPLALRGIEGWHRELEAEWTRILRRNVQRRLAMSAATAWSLRRPLVAARLASLLSSWPGLAARPLAWMNQSRTAPAPADSSGLGGIDG